MSRSISRTGLRHFPRCGVPIPTIPTIPGIPQIPSTPTVPTIPGVPARRG